MPHFPRETCLQYWKYFIQITAEKLIFCRLNVSVYTEKNFYDSFYTLKERVSYADSQRSGSRAIYYFRFHILFSTYFPCGYLGLAISVFAFDRRGLEEFFLWT